MVYFLTWKMQYFGPFWPILLILSQIYAHFRVLFQALIMRLCTKIDKYDVWQWAHYCQVLTLAKLERPTRRRTTWYLVAWLVDCGGRVGLHLWLRQDDLCVFFKFNLCLAWDSTLGLWNFEQWLLSSILNISFCKHIQEYIQAHKSQIIQKHMPWWYDE